MQLSEAIIFESFRDLKTILDAEFQHMLVADRRMLSILNDSIENARDAGVKNIPKTHIMTPEGFTDIIKFVVKHPYVKNEYPHRTDVGRWIREIRQTNIMHVAGLLMPIFAEITDYENAAERQKPDMDLIAKTSSYHIYKLNNYAAARKVCTTYGTNFCTGADPDMFDEYGAGSDRDSYTITLPNKTVIMVHAGRGGFLVTSHDNKNDFSDRGGRGARAVVKDFKKAGVSQEDAIKALLTIIPSRYKNYIQQLIGEAWNEVVHEDLILRRSPFSAHTLTYEGKRQGITFTNATSDISAHIVMRHGMFLYDVERDFADAVKLHRASVMRILTNRSLGFSQEFIDAVLDEAQTGKHGESIAKMAKILQTGTLLQ